MKPVPSTWLFEQKPLDAEDKNFIEKSRYCLRGDGQTIYVVYDPMINYDLVTAKDYIYMFISLSAT